MTADGQPRCLLVVTDLDGTLLDEETYLFDAAAEALAALRARGVPLVLATSKTRREVQPLAAALALPTAWIVENGGAVVIPKDFPGKVCGRSHPGEGLLLTLGVSRARLLEQLDELMAETGIRVRSFARTGLDDIVQLTDLSIESARLAADREYDEPFLVDDEAQVAALSAAARRRNLVVTRGGRFWHLTGAVDKGRALTILLERRAREDVRPVTVGLGDSPNDVSFLAVVDRPILVPRPGGRVDPEVARRLPHAERAPFPGPRGWNAAVLAVLAEQPVAGGGSAS